jgi:hypothetical protein
VPSVCRHGHWPVAMGGVCQVVVPLRPARRPCHPRGPLPRSRTCGWRVGVHTLSPGSGLRPEGCRRQVQVPCAGVPPIWAGHLPRDTSPGVAQSCGHFGLEGPAVPCCCAGSGARPCPLAHDPPDVAVALDCPGWGAQRLFGVWARCYCACPCSLSRVTLYRNVHVPICGPDWASPRRYLRCCLGRCTPRLGGEGCCTPLAPDTRQGFCSCRQFGS